MIFHPIAGEGNAIRYSLFIFHPIAGERNAIRYSLFSSVGMVGADVLFAIRYSFRIKWALLGCGWNLNSE